MNSNTVHVRATRDHIRAAILRAPAVARSGGNLADAMMVRCGMAILGRIRTAFVAKARGGTDEAGDRWAPLSPKTIAYSKTRQRGRGGRTRTEKKRGAFPSQVLDAKQQSRWWDVYRRALAQYRGDKGHAAAVAWIVLKREGAVTLLDKYGHRQVEILRDTGLLLNSLSPGVATGERILRAEPGAVIVGTNRKGARGHHEGDPSRGLPQRRLWPSVNRWPSSWWRDVLDQAKQGLLDIAAFLVRAAIILLSVGAVLAWYFLKGTVG